MRFEKHNDMLFRMLDKPVPLTPDAELPCLVRLIQDDSRMGMFNRDTKPSRLSDFYLAARIVNNNIIVDEFMESDYHRFEIIGYPVADGSKEWALYQMMQGKMVCHKKSPSIMYCEHAGYIRREVRYNCVDHMSVSVWLNGADKSGWQIYTEPKPEPIFTTGDKVTDGVIKGTIIHIEDAIADVCPSTDEYKIELRNLNHIPESPKQDDVEKPLRSMIAEAKAIGKNIRTYYQDIVFTPQALEACLNQGKFRWWNICNWELTTREQNYFPSISTSSDRQIYHEPKPLLAEAKVGDLCQRRDGKWMQIDEIDTEFSSLPPAYRCGAGWWTEKGASVHNQTLDIVHTELLAPEGTKEWALQMMKLGKCVCHVKAPSIKYHRPTHYIKRVVRENCTDDMSDAVWMEGADPTGWQLYEPEQIQEPESMGLAKQICEIDHNLPKGLTSCEAIGLAGFCKECFAKNDGCWKEQEDMKEKPESEQPKPESENIIHGYIPADMRLKYFHLCKFKVGDWVEWCGGQYMVESAPPQSGGRYDIRSPYDELGCSVYPENITRKLSPSEVIVKIGCLSGTIKRWDSTTFHIFHGNGKFSKIDIDVLDKQTRELVESLLKAMRGES